jgi:hypothetical protein
VRTYYANAIQVFALLPDLPVVLCATKCDDTANRGEMPWHSPHACHHSGLSFSVAYASGGYVSACDVPTVLIMVKNTG